MDRRVLDALCVCLADGLLAYYGIQSPPVPVHEMLLHPPPGLEADLSLAVTLGLAEDAFWMRALSGQGVVFANSGRPEPRQRYALACALFVGVCSSEHLAAWLSEQGTLRSHIWAGRFARRLLMPAWMFPAGWEDMPFEALAGHFMLPPEVARLRLQEIDAESHRRLRPECEFQCPWAECWRCVSGRRSGC